MMMNTHDQTIPEQVIVGLFGGKNPELVANPFGLLAQLRSMGAVVQIPFPLPGADRQAWAITRMQEAVQVLRDHEHFTVEGINRPSENSAKPGDAPTFLTTKSMVSVDEPDHRRLRLLVSKAFTPRYIESLRPRIQQMADNLLDRVQGHGQMDLVADYAFLLPINVIAEMRGIPESDWAQIRVWPEAIANGLGVGRQDPGVQEHLRAFGEYAARLVEDKRQHPGEDLTSKLVAIEEEEDQERDRLNETELLSMITLLIFAGHETTTNLIGSGTLMLLDHPEQLAKLKADLSLVPAAVEELLRFNGPATTSGPRMAKEDIELGGKLIKRGDIVLPFLLSADHDETQFTDPEELDIARDIQRHLAFGQGIHVCLGAPLARLEGDIALTTLLTRMPNLWLNAPRESITWRASGNLRGLAALPVAF
jgi:cytochrome P450